MFTADEYTIDDGIAHVLGQIEHIEQRIYEVKYPNIVYPEIVPVSHEAGPFAESISYFSMDSVAKAQFIASMGGDIPIVDVTEGKTTVGVEGGALGYKFNLHELRVSQHLGKPLDALRGQVVRRGVEEFAQDICFNGDTPHNLPGFLNNANVTVLAATGNWSGLGQWSASLMVEMLDTLLLPPDQYGDIATRRTGVELLQTALEIIKKDNIYTTQTGNPLTIRPLNQATAAGVGSVDRAIAYRRDPEVLTFHFPMPLMFHPPQMRGLEVMVPGEFRVSGTEVRYPGAMVYMDGI
jgi:hypothetical protein